MNDPYFIDSFSGDLASLPAKKRRDSDAVLRLLWQSPRFSCFDATEHATLAWTLDRLKDTGMIEYKTGIGYPWCEVRLTDAGKERLK